jgi:hypothetical protein
MIGNVNDKAENQDNSSAHLNPTATFVINPAVGSTETAHGAVRFLKGDRYLFNFAPKIISCVDLTKKSQELNFLTYSVF